ncbi:non-ribosomal peptide synthetase [Amycolatopsis sp. RTGN1]|uniref:non-ribosomal peptide synthetase n=1 Tax=Amycolatopsis ponsaeliensis TaxID=2992142 RepID=UPI00254D5763|nr:non-ribosomal peptide synthetase [Amycolatopsis sp. RTGN1]
MPSLEDKLANVPDHLRELVRRQLAGESAPAAVQPIPPVPRPGPVPMSPAQQRLWFLAELDPGSVEYNAMWALRLQGALDVAALVAAVNRVVERHEALRTTFDAVDGRGVQVVHRHAPVTVPLVNLAGPDAEAALAGHLLADMNAPFDLRGGPLFRAAVVRLGERDHVLRLSMHHLVCDGWSSTLLFAELAELYAAELNGTAAALPPLPVQYADFAAWQHDRAAGTALDGELTYWRHRLDGVQACELPTDRPRPPVRTSSGAVHVFEVPQSLLSRLRDLARESGATLFMTLAASTALLLSRYSGEQDIAVGTVTSGRGRREVEDLIGLFINTVVVRSQVDEALAFTEFLSRVRTTLLEAFDHDEVPFQRLVEALRPERDPSRPPLVQLMVNLQREPVPPRFPGLEVAEVKPPITVSKLDLTFDFFEGAESLTCYLEYSTDLYDLATIERLSGHLLVLLAGLADHPGRPMSAVPMLTAAERHDLTAGWQGPALRYGPARCAHELFDEQAARTPDSVAASCGGERLTFAGLAGRADRLARHLTSLGVRPGVLVGVCLDRGVDAVVALLGVLKAGGAFVPLDPDYPPQRLNTMLADAAAPVVLTQRAVRDRVAGHPATILCLDEEWPAVDRFPAGPPEVAVTLDDLAYVVYTSGSTGTPKGVLVSHRNVHHMVRAWDARYGLTRLRGRCLSVSSLGVDLFFGDFLLSTLFGGELVVCPSDTLADPPALAALLAAQAPEIMVTTPSLLKVLDQELTWLGESLASVRVLAVGSEPWLTEDCVGVLDRLGPDTVVTNNYGATETTVDSTVFEPRADGIGTAAIVPIGRPLANTRVHVLDPLGRPVPAGVFGEIHIGGGGVAQGYLNRPELTRERFLPDPFTVDPGARLYRTGDVGRRRADGTLEIAGRADDQVKVRGFRVELGEVETAMTRHPGIAAAAAAVRRDESGRDRLVGYLVPAGEPAPDLGELRAFLAETLPDPAVPSALVRLGVLPLTPNGTLDRRALPVPDRTERTADRYAAPRTRTESVLAGIWAEVLGADPGEVGIVDNFFGLGGDSILGLQVVSRARRAGLHLTAKQIFLHQTIADLAGVVTVAETPRSVSGPATGAVPLTPVQHEFFESHPDAPAYFAQSVFLELSDGVDTRALATAFTAVLDHHDAFRLRFERTAGGWRQYYADPVPGVLPRIVDLATVDEHAQDQAVCDTVAAAQAALRPGTGPVLDAVLFTFGPSRRPRLFVTAHHLVVDGVTWRVLLSDLDTVHGQAVLGHDVRLEPRTSSYRDWSDRLCEAAAAGRFDGELEYWSGVERSVAGTPGIPVDRPGENTAGTAATVSVRLDAGLTRALLQDVPDVYRTRANDVLLSALVTVLSAWVGSDTVGVELEGHGREDLFEGIDLSRTAGWFTSVFPVALRVPGPGWATILKGVKEQLRAIPAAGLGYGVLRHLRPDTALGRGRGCQVGFNYHGRFDVDVAEDGTGLYREWLASPVADRGQDVLRDNLIEVIGVVRGGELRFDWEYSTAVHDEPTIARLAGEFVTALERIVEHCARPGAGGRTPSDFPLAGLDQDGVDRIAGDGRLVEDVYPLTPMQSGLLFHSLGAHETDIYLTHFGVELHGVADPGLLARAWQRVTDRTPILRTAVAGAETGEPLQIVHREARIPVTHHDWTGLSEIEQRHRKRQLWEDCARDGVDLSRPPLLRLHVARLSGTSVYLLCSSHHILLDGWSFTDVLSEVYEEHAVLAGTGVVTPKTRRPYRDYVRWLAEQDQEAAAEHWSRVLAGFTAPTPLPYDRAPVRAHQSRDSAWFDLALSPEHTRRLQDFTRGARVTVNTVLQGAWAMLLSRYSGEQDVCFGTTVSGRPAELPGADEMIGLFINTIPARVRLDRDLDVLTWLRDMQEDQVDARQYEHVSLAQIRQWSEIPQGSGLFESVVVYENFPHDDDAAGKYGLQAREATSAETSNYPLTCVAYLGEVLHIRFGYDPHLFDEPTGRRLADHLLRLLEDMIAAPERSLRALPVAGHAELRRLLVEWNDSAGAYPERCLQEIFAERARENPDSPAVVRGTDRLTYAELDARANRLAHELIEHGVGPEVPVALYLDGGPELVTAILGVLKAGGAYVPLDPGYPSERLSHMLDDTAIPLVLTESGRAGDLPPTRAEVVHLDERRPAIAARPPVAPAVVVRPDNLAGLIYTSGSTGVPKGSMLTHRGLVRLVLPAGAHTFGGAGRVAQHHSVSFDAAQNELWNALLTGACLVVRPGGFRSVDQLEDFLKSHDVEAMSFAAGFFHAVADTDPGILAGLRKVVVGGEALSPAHCDRVLEHLPHLEIVNAYGPTECAVTTSCFSVEKAALEDLVVPIGHPVANAAVHLLDGDLNLVPTGVAGEAYIAGDGLTRGFWTRPAMTAERFVANPFGPPGARMYRTGDLMRRRADGNLEFVGRTDDQVKIRGFRIELGEVEAAVTGHAGVARAAVVAREDQPGRKRLVAYAVAKAVTDLRPEDLARFVAGKLPDYMVPSAFQVIDRLPLTPHGKVDRRALPAPATESADRPYLAPRTPAEETLASIWAEVLGVRRVGVTDDFFDLGGDSILSIQVVFRSRRAGLLVSSNDLFRYPTVAELATVAGRADQAEATRAPIEGDVPLTPIQREFFERHSVAPNHLTQSLLVELVDEVDEEALRAAFAAVLAHHDALRMRFTRENGEWAQYNAPAEPGEVLHRHDLSTVDEAGGRAAMEALAVEADSTMDLSNGPLLRALLFDLGSGRRPWLHVTAHHLVIDTVSWRMLSDDLDTAYRQTVAGEPVDLGPKTTSFRQWATQLAGHVADGGFDDHLGHWSALPEGTALPTDGSGPNLVSSRRILRVSVSRAETAALLHAAPGRFRARVNDVLLGALAWTLCRWTGENRVLVELEGHGREELFDDIDLSRTVGWFTSSYPVLLEVPEPAGEADWPAVVKAVRRSLRAVPANGLSHGALRYLSRPGAPAAALAERAAPPVLFNYHSRIDEITRTDGRSLYHAFHEGIGQEQDSGERVVQQLEVVGAAQDGRLGFDWHYSVNVHDRATVERVAAEFRQALGALARHSDPDLGEVVDS